MKRLVIYIHGKDPLTSTETVSAFVQRIGASLTVMEDGEHWFHTDEQMRFLDSWISPFGLFWMIKNREQTDCGKYSLLPK